MKNKAKTIKSRLVAGIVCAVALCAGLALTACSGGGSTTTTSTIEGGYASAEAAANLVGTAMTDFYASDYDSAATDKIVETLTSAYPLSDMSVSSDQIKSNAKSGLTGSLDSDSLETLKSLKDYCTITATAAPNQALTSDELKDLNSYYNSVTGKSTITAAYDLTMTVTVTFKQAVGTYAAGATETMDPTALDGLCVAQIGGKWFLMDLQ